MAKRYALVYQAGIANIFSIANNLDVNQEGHSANGFDNYAKLVLQWDFRTCESFCAGLIEAGATVYILQCNMAGDIVGADWNWELDDAPFRSEFCIPQGAIHRELAPSYSN